MRKFRFSRFVLMSVVIVTCVASLIFFLLRDVGARRNISHGLSKISMSMSSLVSYPLSTTKAFFSDLSSVDELRKENSGLQEKLTLLESYDEKMKSLIAENESLKASLDVKNSFEGRKVLTGQVIGRSTVAWLDWISLDVGEKQGVSSNMLVLSNGHLIGLVSETSSSFSTVNLLTNTGDLAEIPVKILAKSGDVYGILSGFDVQKNAYLVTKLNKKLDISKDSQVLTSGLDGKTVANVKLGKVLEVVSEDELNRTVYVTPGADFDHLSYVTLLGE